MIIIRDADEVQLDFARQLRGIEAARAGCICPDGAANAWCPLHGDDYPYPEIG